MSSAISKAVVVFLALTSANVFADEGKFSADHVRVEKLEQQFLSPLASAKP